MFHFRLLLHIDPSKKERKKKLKQKKERLELTLQFLSIDECKRVREKIRTHRTVSIGR